MQKAEMNILIKQATIVDPNSPHNGKKQDILIEKGRITSIRKQIPHKGEVFNANGLHVSPGWFDMQVNFRDPGFEHKEDILSGCDAASQGGFTGVACMPDTNPPLHTKSEIEYIINKSKNLLVDVHPVGALTKDLEGKEMTEMYDMYNSGAVAFSDEKHPVCNAGIMLRALLYSKGINGLVISHSEDHNITLDGKVNEGESSTALGLNGMPGIAEEIMVGRDIELASYAQARLHLASVSTAKSVDLIRNAKKKGLPITAHVAAHQLALDDSVLAGFDTNYKFNPPLRTKREIKALLKGLADGTIDAICSDHQPENVEEKVREFDNAAFGAIGLETAFAAANTYSGLPLPQLISKLAIKPREILGLEVPVIASGNIANLSLFNPKEKWTFTEKDIRSKSSNSPFIGTTFKGKALAVYNNNAFRICK
jgi:dihydroorotase